MCVCVLVYDTYQNTKIYAQVVGCLHLFIFLRVTLASDNKHELHWPYMKHHERSLHFLDYKPHKRCTSGFQVSP